MKHVLSLVIKNIQLPYLNAMKLFHLNRIMKNYSFLKLKYMHI